MRFLAITCLLFISNSSLFASCKHEKETFQKYQEKLKEIQTKHCFFPKTKKRKPCRETKFGKEVRIKKLASQTLLGVCQNS